MSLLNLRKHANDDCDGSLANRLRNKRFEVFKELALSFGKPLKILDVGGTNAFWERRGWAGDRNVEITLINLVAQEKKHCNISPQRGDATDLRRYGERSFDIAFSNSVIEHLYTLENQAKMAKEVQRVAKAYWLQTPNYWFPVEPHFHVFAWQWMPVWLRVAIIRRFSCGWRGPCPRREDARRAVQEVRLMTRQELRDVLPGATIVPERFAAFVKSWIALGGFDPRRMNELSASGI